MTPEIREIERQLEATRNRLRSFGTTARSNNRLRRMADFAGVSSTIGGVGWTVVQQFDPVGLIIGAAGMCSLIYMKAIDAPRQRNRQAELQRLLAEQEAKIERLERNQP